MKTPFVFVGIGGIKYGVFGKGTIIAILAPGSGH
jgi:hypothetical protein